MQVGIDPRSRKNTSLGRYKSSTASLSNVLIFIIHVFITKLGPPQQDHRSGDLLGESRGQ
ncbi:hypothetical protein M426DRAFT_316954 [Hypoxylon sp. CI-4A]|nr:hypothetical protein M426DRAFT_316954 [Hypoxylon sp. CI-4A]